MNYPDKIFPDLSPEQLYETLTMQAYKVEKQTVKKRFTPEELTDLKNELAENTVQIEDAEQDIKDIIEPIKVKLKELKGLRKHLAGKVRKGFDENIEDVFMMDDQENNLMYEYDCEGNLINTRKLSPSEKQASIRSLNQKIA